MAVDEQLQMQRHSCAHVMAEAILNLFPGTKIAIGPAIENGFYYDIDFPTPITEEDLPAIEKEMHKIAARNEKFVRKVVTKEEADVTKEFVHNKEDYFRVLEVGAGSGNMLSRLHYLYPLATIYGIEANETVVRNGIETVPLLCLDWRKDKLPFTNKFFDYIYF